MSRSKVADRLSPRQPSKTPTFLASSMRPFICKSDDGWRLLLMNLFCFSQKIENKRLNGSGKSFTKVSQEKPSPYGDYVQQSLNSDKLNLRPKSAFVKVVPYSNLNKRSLSQLDQQSKMQMSTGRSSVYNSSKYRSVLKFI